MVKAASGAPHAIRYSKKAVPATAETLPSGPIEAKDAILDFWETRGSTFLQGPMRNVQEIAIMTCWGQRSHAICGRLLQFLQSYGVTNQSDCNEIKELFFN